MPSRVRFLRQFANIFINLPHRHSNTTQHCKPSRLPPLRASFSRLPPPRASFSRQQRRLNHHRKGKTSIMEASSFSRSSSNPESRNHKDAETSHCRSIESRIASATVLPPPARAITVFLNLQRKTQSQKNPNEDWAKSNQ
ncbi:uncharacterized protein HKW66_Vig0089370 [Vigna angularis]|uniref:Uncharacterized protein n=1 Tax=Phaseolus angularis TaxID=3914 RepID=A0A8T0KHX3_PHAAN|nr:uncharacterized protein HKW66_Vig0089370 [Vigna angularis]